MFKNKLLNMSRDVLCTVVLLSLFGACIFGKNHKDDCISPQYLELWQGGVVHCDFLEGFYGVFWYNSTDITSIPIVSLKESVKDGEGLHSGEFDILPDGSLIIQNVSVKHEHEFAVMIFKSTVDQPTFFIVNVIATVKPKYPYPVIADCWNKNALCFKRVNYNANISCHVTNARPTVHLWWVIRGTFRDMNISTAVSVSNESFAQTSRASTMEMFQYSYWLALLVCKSEDPGRVLDETETQVLFLNSNANCSILPVQSYKHFKIETRMTLSCGENGISHPLIVWSRFRNNECEDLSIAVSLGGTYHKTLSSDYEMGERGSLVVHHVEPQHEGSYYCIFGNGTADGIIRTDVFIYAIPNPPYPIVEGCDDEPFCILEAKREGSLTCSVYGIRPSVQLEWVPLHGHKLISFSNPVLLVTSRGELFDVTLNASYQLESSYAAGLTVACRVSGKYARLFHMSTELDLVFETEYSAEVSRHLPKSLLIIVLIIAPLALVILLLFAFGIIRHAANRCRQKRQRSFKAKGSENSDSQEDFPMIQTQENDETGNVSLDQYIPDNMEVCESSKQPLSLLGKRKVQMISENYILPTNRNIKVSSKPDNLFIAVIGKTGVGKSATANCIFGRNVFKEETSSVAVTTTSTCQSQRLKGRNINILDTPGLQDSTAWEKNKPEEIERIFGFFSSGVHVFIYVSNMADINTVDEDIQALNSVKRKFGSKIRKFLLLVFSHADNILADHLTLEQFCEAQQKKSEDVSIFLKNFGNMVVAVNNRSNLPAERKRNQTVLLSMVDAIITSNNDAVFVN